MLKRSKIYKKKVLIYSLISFMNLFFLNKLLFFFLKIVLSAYVSCILPALLAVISMREWNLAWLTFPFLL